MAIIHIGMEYNFLQCRRKEQQQLIDKVIGKKQKHQQTLLHTRKVPLRLNISVMVSNKDGWLASAGFGPAPVAASRQKERSLHHKCVLTI